MPVNPLSNSARSTQRGPLAGSLIRTRSFPHRFPIDSTTMKCWKAQKMMAGHPHPAQHRGLGLEALGDQPVAPRGRHHRGRLGAVP